MSPVRLRRTQPQRPIQLLNSLSHFRDAVQRRVRGPKYSRRGEYGKNWHDGGSIHSITICVMPSKLFRRASSQQAELLWWLPDGSWLFDPEQLHFAQEVDDPRRFQWRSPRWCVSQSMSWSHSRWNCTSWVIWTWFTHAQIGVVNLRCKSSEF